MRGRLGPRRGLGRQISDAVLRKLDRSRLLDLRRFGASSDIWCIMTALMSGATVRMAPSALITASPVGAASRQARVGDFVKPPTGYLMFSVE